MTAPVVVLRQSPAWDTITREEYRRQSRAFCLLINRPADQMNEVVDLWDTKFDLSFFETRQAMKDISRNCLADVRGALLVEEAAFAPSEDRPVCFIDDDDWLAPDLGEHLDALPDVDGFIWTHVAIGFSNRLQRFAPATTDWWCFTNNYAVSAAYARRSGIAAVAQHWIADQTFRALRLCYIDTPLSVANKHPASVVFLERSVDGRLDVDKLERVIADFVHGLECIDTASLQGLEWARPHIDATHRHFARVLASAR